MLGITSNLNVILKPGNIDTIKDEPLFYNWLFKDPMNNQNVFKLTRLKKQMPKTVKEIQNYPYSREQEINNTVRRLTTSIEGLVMTYQEKNEYCIDMNGSLKAISTLSFKELYNKINREK